MQSGASFTVAQSSPAGNRPRDDELDLFGLTHRGLVRAENEDHFLLCTVHPQVVIHATSLPEPDRVSLRGQRLATIMLVADGVGGRAAGARASQIAAEATTRYLASSLRSYSTTDSSSEAELMASLRAAAIEAHETVRDEARTEPGESGMATTLSLGVVVWPWLYVVQVGDSRCYFYQDGALRQVTRDQTVAQDLIDSGVLPRERALKSPLHDILASAIGGTEAVPEISRVDVRTRGCVILVCTDGLTKHVSDEEITRHLTAMESAEQVCGALLALALERGGTDNVTLVIGRARRTGDSGAVRAPSRPSGP